MLHYSSNVIKLVNAAINRTFAWMSTGLALTATISFLISQSHFMHYLLNASAYGSILRFSIIAVQFILVIALMAFSEKMSYSSMVATFLAFSGVMGMSLATIFLIYSIESIIGIFFITSGMFASLCIYGLITKRDLGPIGYFAGMVLFGMIIFGLINTFFVKSAAFVNVLSFIGVIVFSALTAYDIQNVKVALAEMAYDTKEQNKMSIKGALMMYLNFINLFLNLLKLFGKKRD
jgi:FtsH-binding integral membrane protein